MQSTTLSLAPQASISTHLEVFYLEAMEWSQNMPSGKIFRKTLQPESDSQMACESNLAHSVPTCSARFISVISGKYQNPFPSLPTREQWGLLQSTAQIPVSKGSLLSWLSPSSRQQPHEFTPQAPITRKWMLQGIIRRIYQGNKCPPWHPDGTTIRIV